MHVRQLFFDLDRTLWDFETNSKKTLQYLYEELRLGENIDHFNHFHHTYIRVNADLWQLYGKGKLSKEELRDSRFKKALAHHGIHDQVLATKMSNDYVAISPRQTNLLPGAIETLNELKRQNYRMHIITNGFREAQVVKLENSGLDAFFDTVLCSEDIGKTKPHREIFVEAQNKSNCLSKHAVMIGDDFKTDVIGALNAGWSAIHFDPERKFKKERSVPRVRELKDLPEVINLLPIVGG